MSSFKHHRNSNTRYNIYEYHVEEVETKSFYITLRNTLFFIALILSLFITGLISFDTYKNKTNQVQKKQIKDETTRLELTKAISNSIIQKIGTNNSFESINHHQLKRIVKNVIEKVEKLPNQIIYTKK